MLVLYGYIHISIYLIIHIHYICYKVIYTHMYYIKIKKYILFNYIYIHVDFKPRIQVVGPAHPAESPIYGDVLEQKV